MIVILRLMIKVPIYVVCLSCILLGALLLWENPDKLVADLLKLDIL